VKSQISTLPQAQKHLKEAIDAVRAVTLYLDSLSATLGLSAFISGLEQSANGQMPTTMLDRVLKIVSDAPSPLN
jgi:hypothetical protein